MIQNLPQFLEEELPRSNKTLACPGCGITVNIAEIDGDWCPGCNGHTFDEFGYVENVIENSCYVLPKRKNTYKIKSTRIPPEKPKPAPLLQEAPPEPPPVFFAPHSLPPEQEHADAIAFIEELLGPLENPTPTKRVCRAEYAIERCIQNLQRNKDRAIYHGAKGDAFQSIGQWEKAQEEWDTCENFRREAQRFNDIIPDIRSYITDIRYGSQNRHNRFLG